MYTHIDLFFSFLLSGRSAWDSDIDKVIWVQTIVSVEVVRGIPQMPPSLQMLQIVTGDKKVTFISFVRDAALPRWVKELQRLVGQNRRVAEFYHPGLAQRGRWSCCNQPRSATGCRRCTNYR